MKLSSCGGSEASAGGWSGITRRSANAGGSWRGSMRCVQEPARQFGLSEGAEPAVVAEALVDPEADMAASGFERGVHDFVFAHRDDGVIAAVKAPDGGAAEGACIFGGKRGDIVPAFGRVAPEDAAGGDGDSRPAFGISAGKFPCAVAAEREAGEIGACGVGVELDGFLVEGGHGHGHHVGVGPVVDLRTLGHHDDEGPAFGMIAHRLGEADLGLPHAFGAALAAPVEEQNDGPLPMVVAPPVFGEVDLEAIE